MSLLWNKGERTMNILERLEYAKHLADHLTVASEVDEKVRQGICRTLKRVISDLRKEKEQ